MTASIRTLIKNLKGNETRGRDADSTEWKKNQRFCHVLVHYTKGETASTGPESSEQPGIPS